MNLIITLIAIDVIASKFLDSYIKSNRFEPSQRTNSPFTGKLCKKLGIENDVWISFFSTVFVTGLSVHLLSTFYTAAPYQLLYIFTGLFTTTLNLGSAHSNYFGRRNFITKKLLAR